MKSATGYLACFLKTEARVQSQCPAQDGHCGGWNAPLEFDPKVIGRLRTGLNGIGLKVIQQRAACQPCAQPRVLSTPSERGDLGIGWEYS